CCCPSLSSPPICPSFSFPAPPPTHIYTLSLHDALPISYGRNRKDIKIFPGLVPIVGSTEAEALEKYEYLKSLVDYDGALALNIRDRKSTRLNSSHVSISYAVFCLKKKTYKI